MADLSMVLPVGAALMHATGFILYNVQTKLGKSDPNPASWFLWTFLATFNALTFSAMNDWVAAMQFFAGSVGCIATFFYVLVIGRFEWPTKREWWMLVVGLGAIFVWRQFTATAANMILVGVIAWSFEPTVRGVWLDPFKEKPAAWYLWTGASVLTAISTYFYKGGWTSSMVAPIVLALVHGVVADLCGEARRDHFAIGNPYGSNF